MDEARLIGQLRASSRRAFDEIYRLYAARLYAFCLQYCKVREDAEEIVEDVFVKLWTVRKDIRSEQSLKSLLFTISRRQLINAYRRTVNAPEFAGYVEMLGVMSAEDASAHIEYDEFVGRLHRELARLPDTQRRVVRLSRVEGLSNREIAARLNIGEQTVKNQLSLGLKRLRKAMGQVSPLLCAILGMF